MKSKVKIVVLTVVLLLVLVSMSSAGSSTQYAIEWDVAGAGGAPMTSLPATYAPRVMGCPSSPEPRGVSAPWQTAPRLKKTPSPGWNWVVLILSGDPQAFEGAVPALPSSPRSQSI